MTEQTFKYYFCLSSVMATDGHNTHAPALEYLASHLHLVGIDLKAVSYVIIEPKEFVPHRTREMSLCDMIVGYDDNSADAIEVKGCWSKIDKARDQLFQGRHFIKSYLKAQFRNGIFVVYHDIGSYAHRVLI
jgi:hypothetical protein